MAEGIYKYRYGIVALLAITLLVMAMMTMTETDDATNSVATDLKADFSPNSGINRLETVEMPKRWVSEEGRFCNEIPLETGKLYIGEGMGMFVLDTRQGGVTRFSYGGEEISLVISSSSNIPYKEGTFEMFKGIKGGSGTRVFLSDTVFKRENVVEQNSENANYVCVMFEIT